MHVYVATVVPWLEKWLQFVSICNT